MTGIDRQKLDGGEAAAWRHAEVCVTYQGSGCAVGGHTNVSVRARRLCECSARRTYRMMWRPSRSGGGCGILSQIGTDCPMSSGRVSELVRVPMLCAFMQALHTRGTLTESSRTHGYVPTAHPDPWYVTHTSACLPVAASPPSSFCRSMPVNAGQCRSMPGKNNKSILNRGF